MDTGQILGTPGKFTDYQRILGANETKDGSLSISVRFPTLRYIEEFVALKCASDMLDLGLFPNAKEITESFACYRAARNFVPFELSDPDVTVVVVGDGSTPRTAATFAFRSNWKCVSIDPELRAPENWQRSIKRLTCHAKKIEAMGRVKYPKVVIVAPHSHAPLEVALDRFQGKRRHVVAMPCCVRQELNRLPDTKYDDWGIHSPQRAVMVWNEV